MSKKNKFEVGDIVGVRWEKERYGIIKKVEFKNNIPVHSFFYKVKWIKNPDYDDNTYSENELTKKE